MEKTAEMSSSAMEQKSIDAIGSTENMLDRNDSLDRAASSLVKATDISQQRTAIASGLSGDDNQMEMDTKVSNGKALEEKQLELMDVNDDCLRAICKQLPILDLASVADVCKRFQSIAQETFRLAKPIVRIPQDEYRPTRPWTLSKIADEDKIKVIQRASRLLRLFGPWMTVLEVDENYHSLVRYDEKIVALVIKYCGGGSLIALKLHLIELPNLFNDLEPIFRSLRKLDFYCIRCDGRDAPVSEWLTVIENLTLKSNTEALWDALFKRIYPNLQRISFVPGRIDAHDCEMFLNANKTIKDIFTNFWGVNNHNMKLPMQVEKLHVTIDNVHSSRIDTDSFRDLKHLKSLRLHSGGGVTSIAIAIIRGVVAGNIPLEHLALTGSNYVMTEIEFNEICDAVSKLNPLNTLTLDAYFRSVDELIQFSPKLHRLSELRLACIADPSFLELVTADELMTIASSFHNLQRLKIGISSFTNHSPEDTVTLDSKSFERFVSIVQKRNNNTHLDIELDVRCYKWEIPDDLAERNRHVLRVKIYEIPFDRYFTIYGE